MNLMHITPILLDFPHVIVKSAVNPPKAEIVAISIIIYLLYLYPHLYYE